jgi:7,8-dihydropterin-6-yl-methyl-4-(beta-D-ribofuranosyl)aminobenzene 5'-phosphate synthase
VKYIKAYSFLIFFSLGSLSDVFSQEQTAQITILYDAFGNDSPLKQGWGFSALVEYRGKRVLFDTGGDNDIFEYNVKTLGVDLTRLDMVVLTHRHGDHTSGLNYVLSINPGVKIYTPLEGGAFGTPINPALMKLIQVKVESVPKDLRYFDGNPPERMTFGTPWPGADFIQIREQTEVMPGFFLFTTTSDIAGTKEMNEISMALRTPRGIVLIVGCSHPGIGKILDAASKINPQIYSVFGGFHLVDMPQPGVAALARSFRDKWKIGRMAPGHCTGQYAFSEFIRVYGTRFDHAGLGSITSLPVIK